MEFESFEQCAAEEQYTTAASEKKRLHPAVFAAVGILCAAVIAIGAIFGVPAVRYHSAVVDLAQGEFARANKTFKALGDYKDAQDQLRETEKGFVYLEADALLQQGQYEKALAIFETLGDFYDTPERIREVTYLLAVKRMGEEDWKTAQDFLARIEDYRDAAALLEQIANEQSYKQAWAYMVTEKYETAEEKYRELGDFRDAAEKAEECRRLGEAKKAYEEGSWQYKDGKWLAAYRTLSAIRDMDYEDTGEILEEISSVAEEKTRHYAERGDRGKMLAFLQLAEEIDREKGAALRQELAPVETFEKDMSYYLFDLKEKRSCSPDTQAEEYLAVLLYMITYGKTTLTLMSNSKLDKDTALEQVFTAENILSEIMPGYGSVYNFGVTVWENGVELELDYDKEISEHQRNLHIATYKSFCEESLKALTETGLISSSMSFRKRAEIISEWIGFYLTYDLTLEIHDAGVAVEEAKGVCESYAVLYHRMCNLAGIPTYGQTGNAGERHIWLVHVDEEGKIFYADPTWADPWDIDFSREEERPTVEDFAEQYLERCMIGAVAEHRYANYTDGAGQNTKRYFWSGTLWSTHRADRPAEDIIAVHQKLLGKTA